MFTSFNIIDRGETMCLCLKRWGRVPAAHSPPNTFGQVSKKPYLRVKSKYCMFHIRNNGYAN